MMSQSREKVDNEKISSIDYTKRVKRLKNKWCKGDSMKNFKDCIIYQIYPKSFKDSNGDGFGDLEGVIQKLDYLQFLGVDMIWLTPFFVSPQKDNGYDIADYYKIDTQFGTMKDFEHLVEEAKKRKIDIMLDMVFNHTSTEHSWFQKALAGEKTYQDYYIFKEGQKGGAPPTNWRSKFGGSAWEYVENLNKYYLHLFDKTQADLNWENENLREELTEILKFWMKKGVKGFRFDVINLISKPKVYEEDNQGDGRRFYTDGPKIHEYIREMNLKTFGEEKGIITVGEMSSTTMEHCFRYSGAHTQELSMVFNFHHLKVDFDGNNKWLFRAFDFKMLKEILNAWQLGMQNHNAWTAVFWCNHDQTRALSRFGDDGRYRIESAKMLATTIHCLRGTPYIYQGEEIGMTNAYYGRIGDYRDVESLNYFQLLQDEGSTKEEALALLQLRSRDNARTPMQWNKGIYADFSEVEPWIPVVFNYETINAEASMRDKNSIFYHYKKLITLRRQYEVIANGSFEPILMAHKKVFAYKRIWKGQTLLVINHFYKEETEVVLEDITGYRLLLSNYKERALEEKLCLKPYESMVYLREEMS